MKRLTSRLSSAFLVLAMSAMPPAIAEDAPVDVLIVDQAVGDGPEVQRGWFAIMHFTGWIYDEQSPEHKGRLFASSRERGQPTTFVYGYQRALLGLEKGMRGMKVGGKRTIIMPPKLGYDGFKHPTPKDVPPGSTLVFDVELLDVVPQQNSN